MSLNQLREMIRSVRDLVDGFEPREVRGEDAAGFVDAFAELERLAVAGRTLAGRRVEETRVWYAQGFRTSAQWMAAHSQSTVASAIATLETARRMEELPAAREAFKTGVLSAQQAQEISAAASASPAAEGSLLEAAQQESVAGLRERCRQVIASAARNKQADERLHRSRCLRHWTDADGMLRLDVRLTPDVGAPLVTGVLARARELRDQACRAGVPERREAYAADALVDLVGGDKPRPKATVHVHVDHAAWQRGHTQDQERCHIPGIGPVPVSTARRLASDGIVKAVLDEGADVRAVANMGRTIPARLRTALEARDRSCVVPGCDVREDLEIDHTIPLAHGGRTSLDNLARLCRYHHGLKTHRGWRLEGRPGSWRWHKPPRDGPPRPG